MSPEFNLVDLLLEDEMSLAEAIRKFPDEDPARRVLRLYVKVDALVACRDDIPVRRQEVYRVLGPPSVGDSADMTLSLSERGSAYLLSGRWDELFK